MLNEQRRTIIAEYCRESFSSRTPCSSQAEHDRRVLQEELLRQQQDFREVHQQDLIKQQELQKFRNSAYDEFTRQKFIEDEKIIMELSGRLQELQNEVNFMNDSKDFMDAESICSGNPHVARGMGSSRLACNRRRRTREGPEPACVQTPNPDRVAHAGEEGRINILPWYRPAGVAKTNSESRRRENRAARKGKWSPRWYGDDSPHLSLPNSQPCIGGS